jgi:hypothetical protein
MIAEYNNTAVTTNANTPSPDTVLLSQFSNIKNTGFMIPTEYSGFAIPPVNTSRFSSIMGDLSTNAELFKQSFSSGLNMPPVNIVPVTSGDNPDRDIPPTKEDGLIASLIKLLLGIITLGKKFAIAFSAIGNAAMGITMSAEGLVKIGMLSIFHIANIFKVSMEVVIHNITVLTDIVIKLPKCFLVHIIKMIFAVLYLIFPAFSYICWSLTGVSLMPAFNATFKMLDEGDNWVSDKLFNSDFYLLKFPRSITKHCYYCNGKPYRLDDIMDGMNKVGNAGTKYNRDLERKAYPAMKPAKPYLLRTKRLVDKLMK